MSKAIDGQVGGNHYKEKKIQPWHIIDEYHLDFYAGNVLKYILRDKNDNKLEDLKKARHYLDKLIEGYSPTITVEDCEPDNFKPVANVSIVDLDTLDTISAYIRRTSNIRYRGVSNDGDYKFKNVKDDTEVHFSNLIDFKQWFLLTEIG